MFFCQPFRYPRWFKKLNITLLVALTTIIVFIYIIYTELTIGRKLAYVSFTCQLQDVSQSFIQMVVFIIIPLTITMFCVIAISRVLTKQRMRIIDLTMVTGRSNSQSIATSNNANEVNPIKQLVKNGGKTIRLIVMVSGVFLVSIIPSAIFRQTVTMNGITWYDIETRSVFWASVLMRLESTIGSILFSTVNPLIYYYIEKVFYYELKMKLNLKIQPSEVSGEYCA